MAGPEVLSVVSILPFDLSSQTNNTLSLLLIVWDGGLQRKAVEKFAASLRKEERLHLRLAILTRHGEQSAWTEDAIEQRRLLEEAAAAASSSPADRPGYLPKSSDEQVLERRWEDQLRLSVEDTIAQAGKQVILELLPKPPLLPPEGPEHWRMPRDRDYAGEPRVHTFAALGVVPVYRAHGEISALAMIIPGEDAFYSPALDAGGYISGADFGQEQLAKLQGLPMPSQLPAGSRLFGDLGGKDVFEAKDALPYILGDLKRVYTVVGRTPAVCTPRGLVPLRIRVTSSDQSGIRFYTTPLWAMFYLLQRPGIGDE